MHSERSVDRIRAVTFNLGCGGPRLDARRDAAREWGRAVAAAGHYDVVFAQEIPADDWEPIWSEHGYVVSFGLDKGWKTRSAVIVRSDTVSATPMTLPNADYHGSYLAAVRLDVGWFEPLVVVSVHASPQRVTPEWRSWWKGQPLPSPRADEDLWDADMVLATLAQVKSSLLLAAGDFNEARGWDLNHAGTSGVEYFERVADAGLRDCTYERWGGVELATHNDLQLDHVLATRLVADRVVDCRVADVDPAVFDHRAIEFDIEVALRPQ